MKTITTTSAKKIFLSLLLLLLFFPTEAFAQVDGKITQEFPTKDEALETAKQTVAAYESGDWDQLRRNVKPEVMFYNLGSYDSLSLDQTIGYWKKGRETATPALDKNGMWLAVSVPEGPREGNWVLHWGRNTLSYPNGESITFPYHVALKMKDDKVIEVHFYYDNNRIIRELGYEIQPPLKDDQDN